MAALALITLTACSDDDNNESDNNAGATTASELAVTQAGRFQVDPFAFDEGAAEIVAHDAALNRLFVNEVSGSTTLYRLGVE